MKASRLETIGSAAAGIAHDINNQLTLIVNHLAIADLEGAQKAVVRCSALTSDLLSYCRGERTSPEPLDAAAFLQHFAGELSLPPGVEFVLDAPLWLPNIMAEPVALMRTLSNLVSNACAAMNGRGRLRITASPGVIEVRDSGPGIPEEARQRIFEPFFSTKGEQGTGLGLAIVREMMRQQGCSATVYSEPGQGARFVLRFRMA